MPPLRRRIRDPGWLNDSDLAPQAECQLVYAADGYESSPANLQRVSLSSDMVFHDGWDQELGTAAGSNDSGWNIALTITV